MNEQEILARIKEEEMLLNYEGADKVITSHEAKKQYDEYRAKMGKGLVCGLNGLHDVIGSFDPGTLTVISGHQGNGKSLLVVSLINDFAACGKNSVLFPLEMGAGILKRFKIMPTFYTPKEQIACSIQWIRQRVLEAKIKYSDVGAVFIDHLAYLETAERMQWRNESLQIGDMVRYLSRSVAKDLNVALFLVAHTVDKPTNRDRATIDDIGYSGMIKREADYVLMVNRLLKPDTDPLDKLYSDYSTISLEKHRATGVNHKSRVQWQSDACVFREK